MRFLAVHPGPLMYTKVFLRLEPLGLELVAEAARRAGHEVRILDLQVESTAALMRVVDDWRPDAVAFSCNYLPNVPEIIDHAKAIKARLPRCSASSPHGGSGPGLRSAEHLIEPLPTDESAVNRTSRGPPICHPRSAAVS